MDRLLWWGVLAVRGQIGVIPEHDNPDDLNPIFVAFGPKMSLFMKSRHYLLMLRSCS